MKVFLTNLEDFFPKYLSNALNQKGHEVTGPEENGKEDTAMLVRSALRADIMVLLAMEAEISPLVSSILAALEFGRFPGHKHLVLVSSLMTWAGTMEARRLAEASSPTPMGLGPSGELGEGVGGDLQESLPLAEEDWEGRVPHAAFLELRRVESQVIALASENLSTCVVSSGLMYGDGEDLLYTLFRDAWLKKPVQVPSVASAIPESEDGLSGLDEPAQDNRGGTNQLPVIHVADLCELLVALVNHVVQSGKLPRSYIVGAENSSISLKELCTSISASLGTGELTYLTEAAYTEKIVEGSTDFSMLQLNVPLYLSNGYFNVLVEQDVIRSVAPGGILRCMPQVVQQFKQSRGLNPIRVAILGYPWSGKTKYAKDLGDSLGLEVVDPVVCVEDVAANVPSTPAPKERKSQSSLPTISKEHAELIKTAQDIHAMLKAKKLKVENLAGMSTENLLNVVPLNIVNWCITRQLKRPEIQNRGFVLDAAPADIVQVQTLLTIPELTSGKASRRMSRATLSRGSERTPSRQKKGRGKVEKGGRSRTATDATDKSDTETAAKDLKLDQDLRLTHAIQLQGNQETLLERAVALAKESGLEDKKLAKEQEKFVQAIRLYKERERLPSGVEEDDEPKEDQPKLEPSQALPHTILYLKEAIPELVCKCIDIEDEEIVLTSMLHVIQSNENSGHEFFRPGVNLITEMFAQGGELEDKSAMSDRVSSAASHTSSRRTQRHLLNEGMERTGTSKGMGISSNGMEEHREGSEEQATLLRQDSGGEKSLGSAGTAGMARAIENMRPEEYRDLEERSARFSKYLLSNVSSAIARGFLKIYEKQPDDPCDFLADYLLEQGVVAEKQAEAAAYLHFEGVLAQLRVKEDYEEEELMKRSTGVDSNMSRRSHRGVPKF